MKRPSEEQIMAYLYQELSSEEMVEMEQLISKDDELAAEIKSLKEIREKLFEVKDEEIVEPYFMMGNLKRSTNISQKINRLLWNPVVGIAATLLVLLVLGFLLKVNADFTGNTLRISLGESENVENTEYLTREEALELVNQGISASQQPNENGGVSIEMVNNLLNERSFNQKQELQRLAEKQDENTEAIIGEFIAQLQKDNMVMIERFLELSQEQQQQYMQTVLTDYTEFLETQREQDLQQIENHLVNLQQNQQIREQETDQVLASIMNTVNNQYLNE